MVALHSSRRAWLRGDLSTTAGWRCRLDLGNRPEAISARSVDDQTRVASGCGKEATYVEICAGRGHEECTWLLNSAIRPAHTPGSAQ